MSAVIDAISYYLPKRVLSNAELAAQFDDWTAEKIEAKTGIAHRHIAGVNECVSDLVVEAAEKLFAQNEGVRDQVDFVIVCTQTADYLLPTTACLVQHRLNLPQSCGAMDVNLGCSGYVYSLSLAKGLIETGQAKCILLLTGDTYSKYIHPGDKSVRTLFGDAASATIISCNPSATPSLGPFVFGTDGRGMNNLIIPNGGARHRYNPAAEIILDESGNRRTSNHLYMNGPEVFAFAQRVVPQLVSDVLDRSKLQIHQIDLFVCHQASQLMLDFLRRKLRLSEERMPTALVGCGNTVSSTIPITLSDLARDKVVKPEHTLMLLGFGVGYSWAGAIVKGLGK